MLPIYVLLLAGLIAMSVLVLARQRPAWFPWLVLPLALVPSLLRGLGLGFLAMMTMYVAYPAVMGPFALSAGCFLAYDCGQVVILIAVAAVGASLLWLALLRWLWVRRPWAGYLLWLLGLLAAGWLMYGGILPPD